MFKQITTQTYNWILIIGVILFVFEIVFSSGGTLISIAFSALFLYIGWKNFDMLWGKIVFLLFLISVFFLVLNLVAVRFFVLAAVVILLINYTKSTKEPTYIKPILPGEENLEKVIRMEPLFNHTLFDDHHTEETVYQWRDVNIHGLTGERVIDLSNTVLPNDTAVISIRHGLGNIEIYVPYEVEVSVHHSAIFGKAHIFDENLKKLFNKSLYYQTENYDTAVSRVKIITSLFSGDIEVKRI